MEILNFLVVRTCNKYHQETYSLLKIMTYYIMIAHKFANLFIWEAGRHAVNLHWYEVQLC